MLLVTTAVAQSVVQPRNVPATRLGSVDAADFDADGDADLLITGENLRGEPVTAVLRFLERVEEPIPNAAPRIVAVHEAVALPLRLVTRGVGRWADVNGDGLPDITVAGLTELDNGLQPITEVFLNQNATTFAPLLGTPLPPVFDGDLDWGDYDGDGDLDLLLAGRSPDGPITRIFRQDAGLFLSPIAAPLVGLAEASVDWGDYDGDGDLDALAAGFTAAAAPVVHLYRNDGNDTFTNLPLDIAQLYFSKVRWGDYDADGDLDILQTGGRIAPTILRAETYVWTNENGRFTASNTTFDGALDGVVAWGDYDGDGDLDLFITGQGENTVDLDGQILRIYANQGGSLVRRVVLGGMRDAAATWYDYNGDGRMDIFIMGVQNGLLDRIIYEF